MALDYLINLFELPLPISLIQKGSHIESVVIAPLWIIVERRGQCSHFMPVYSVINKKVLYFVCHLF